MLFEVSHVLLCTAILTRHVKNVLTLKKCIDFEYYFLRKAHGTEQTPFTKVVPSDAHVSTVSLKQHGKVSC